MRPRGATLVVESRAESVRTCLPSYGQRMPDRISDPRRRLRLALLIMLAAAAMPLRIGVTMPVVHSIDLLDLVLIPLSLTLVLDLALHRIDVGYPPLFVLLLVPAVVTLLSLAWSQDRQQSLRTLIIYVEGLLAYLIVIREARGLSLDTAIAYVIAFAYLLIVPGLLLLLHVPGFAPRDVGLSRTSGSYLSYYTRLSHPVLGRSNNLATVLAFLIPVLFVVGHQYSRRSAWVAGTVVTSAVIATLSRGTMIALVMGWLTWVVVRKPANSRRRAPGRRIALVLGFVTSGLAALVLLNPDTRALFGTRFSLVNADLRVGLLREAFTRLADRPFLGFGAGVFPDPALAIGVHNTYVQQMLYFGVLLGAVVDIALVLPAVLLLAHARSNPLLGAVGCGVVLELVVFVFESSFEGTVLRVLFYLELGLLMAVARSSPHTGASVVFSGPRAEGGGRSRPVPVVAP
jgi:hypothetical protein